MSTTIQQKYFSFILNLLLVLFVNPIHCIGISTRIQCPEGHFLSRFSSAFDGTERYYKFGCQAFNGLWLPEGEEQCKSTEFTALEPGSDIFLSCDGNQYTAGIQIVESMPSIIGQLPTEHWQLLCCHSNLIRVRTDDCVETKFINDFKRSSTFSSSAQIIRRWQAMSENSDRRWWLQICPIDIQLTIKRRKNLEKEVDVRARRQVPVEWSNSRFSYSPEHNPSKLKPFFRRGVQIHPNKLSQRINNVNSYSAGNEVGISPKIQSTTTTTSSPTITSSSSKAFEISVPEKEEEEENTTIVEQKNNTNETTNNKSVGRRLTPLRHSRLLQFNEKTRIRLTTSKQDKTTNENIAKIKTQTTTKNFNELRKTTTPHSTDVLDYYDMFVK